MKTTQILALGELLIDYTPLAPSPAGMAVFEQNPGGGPANVLACAAKLGRSAAFIGKVGDDTQGRFLSSCLKNLGIDTRGLILDENYSTTLAFVSLDEQGERSFSFIRKPGADTRLTREELNRDLIRHSELFLFSSLSLTDEPARGATMEALRLAKQSGAVIAFDPNYRGLLWNSPETAKEQMRGVLPAVDLLKVSEEELALLTDWDDPAAGAAAMLGMGISCTVVTMGERGALVVTKEGREHVPPYPARTEDTTGAGDAFWGGFLARFSETGKKPVDCTLKDFALFAAFGNAAASLCVEKRGAMPAMPTRLDVLTRMGSN
jgi:fructokinase